MDECIGVNKKKIVKWTAIFKNKKQKKNSNTITIKIVINKRLTKVSHTVK